MSDELTNGEASGAHARQEPWQDAGTGPGAPAPRRARRVDASAPLSLLSLAMLLLAGLAATPFLAEHVQYAITRGQQRAEADMARMRLARHDVGGDVFRLAAQCVGPSVVQIESLPAESSDAQDAAEAPAGDSPRDPVEGPDSGDSPEDALPRRPWHGDEPPQRSAGQGAGVIVDDEGFILTNYHVVSDAATILVKLSDGRIIRGVEMVGSDAPTDLAVLKINAGSLTAANWGDSDALEVGDWVLAVGNPFGLDRSVTAGIISAKRRRGVILGTPYQDLLQTDAAVNPGNSGGPLVNLQGEVVGINTAILGRTYQGVSFAIPSGVAREIYQQIRSQGAVERGWLGVALDEVSPQVMESLRLPASRGALVTRVLPGTPAERAGFKVGDIVVDWNGRPIDAPEDLSYEVAGTKIGERAAVVIVREGEEVEVSVEVGRRPVMR